MPRDESRWNKRVPQKKSRDSHATPFIGKVLRDLDGKKVDTPADSLEQPGEKSSEEEDETGD